MPDSSSGASPTPPRIAESGFPAVHLPITPPFPVMQGTRADVLPEGERWVYEPKWDGFRALAFRDGDTVVLQSKAGQPLARYFPEVADLVRNLHADHFVLDGELVIPAARGLSFEDLLLRIHPAASRIEKLSRERPAHYVLFDLLVEQGESLLPLPLAERRARLERFLQRSGADRERMRLSPQTGDPELARQWLHEFGGIGLDGVMAKDATAPWVGARVDTLRKFKRMRTADCVIGGFRYRTGTRVVGTLLFGLYNEQGLLDQVGQSSALPRDLRDEITPVLEKIAGRGGFTGRIPGPSRWARGRDPSFVPVEPVLVCEILYDHFSEGRFRHAVRFLRWRPEKRPEECTYGQVGRRTPDG